MSLALAVALVYTVMVSLYESFRDPLVIMGSVPLALIGVVYERVHRNDPTATPR